MLDTHLGGKDVDYEVKMNLRYNDGVYKVDIDGRIDALTKMELWELKCVKALAKEHFLQTAVYAWMWMHSTEGRLARGSRSFRLLNFRTGEMWAIKDEYGIETAVAVIIEAKYSEKPVMSDKSFLAMCHSFHRVQAKRDLNSSQKAFLPRSPSQKGTGSRPFKCFACEPTRSFGTKQALLEHNMKVHG